MSYQDIAKQLALSNDNIRKRLQQAREILQKHLNNYLSGLNDFEVEEPKFDEPTTSDFPESMSVDRTVEKINYWITATCLKTLPLRVPCP